MLPCLADRVLRMLLPASHREAEAQRELPLSADRDRSREGNTIRRRTLTGPLCEVVAASAELEESCLSSSMTVKASTLSLWDHGCMEICQNRGSLT